MTLEEIETLIDDTKKLPHAGDRVALATAVGVLEVARQLSILNSALASAGLAKAKAKAAK